MLTHTSNKTCGKCAVLDKPTGICALTGHHVDPDADFCSQWTDNVQVCDICGRQFIGPGTLTEVDGKYKQTCTSCDDVIGTCRTCENRNKGYCAFQDRSVRPDVPPVIMKSMQKGNATFQAQVRNPERENIICVKCLCWKDDYGCCREARTCGNYKTKW